MGFWDQMNSKGFDKRRSRNHPSSMSGYADSPINSTDETDGENNDLSLEKLLEQWDMCNVDPEHPEWLHDPDFLSGYAKLQIMDTSSFEDLGRAADNGNMLAIVAIGDFYFSVFTFSYQNKIYRFGTDEDSDNLIRTAMSAYVLAALYDPFTQKMQERLWLFKKNFAHESDFMNELEKLGERLNDFSFEHPEELRKILSL